MCKSKTQINPKESNSLESVPETPKPPEEGETAAMGFFFEMRGETASLSHVGINEFGRWATTHIENHPEVIVSICPERSGYEELKLMKRWPKSARNITCDALVDTGPQMVVIGMNTVHNMGLKECNLIPVGLKSRLLILAA